MWGGARSVWRRGARKSLKPLLTLSVKGAGSASADAFHWHLPEMSTIPGLMPRGDHVASHCRRSRLLWPRTSTTAPQFEMILLSMRSGRAPTWGRFYLLWGARVAGLRLSVGAARGRRC